MRIIIQRSVEPLDSERFDIGSKLKLLREDEYSFFIHRDLSEWVERVERGEIAKITFPYEVEV